MYRLQTILLTLVLFVIVALCGIWLIFGPRRVATLAVSAEAARVAGDVAGASGDGGASSVPTRVPIVRLPPVLVRRSAIEQAPPVTDRLASPDDGTSGATISQTDATGPLPLMIRWSNWREEFGPAIVYAREQDLAGMLALDAPVTKMLMVTSFGETERLMARAAELQAAGVTWVGLNTENGLTPRAEMATLFDPDPSVNVVARVARLVQANGFGVVWGPVRLVADQVPDATIQAMMEAGVTGLSLQEQKFIERSPADQRLAAVDATIERYLDLAADVGVPSFVFHVQIMHQRCPDMNACVRFVQGLEMRRDVVSLAIWSNGPIPTTFVDAVREG